MVLSYFVPKYIFPFSMTNCNLELSSKTLMSWNSVLLHSTVVYITIMLVTWTIAQMSRHTFVPSRARVFASDDKIALKRYNRWPTETAFKTVATYLHIYIYQPTSRIISYYCQNWLEKVHHSHQMFNCLAKISISYKIQIISLLDYSVR